MPEEMLAKAKAYFQEGAVEKALMVLMRYLGQNPNDPHGLELRGDIAIREGYVDEALMRLERAAEFFHLDGNYERAIVCFEKALGLSPNQSEYLMRLADFYQAYGLANEMLRKMISYCERSLKSDKTDAFVDGLRRICAGQAENLELRFVYGRILSALNKIEEARTELTNVRHLAQQQSNRKVLDEINRFTSQSDGGEELDPKSRIELGNLLLEIGSKEEAVIEFMRASGDLVKMGQIDEARRIFNRILEIEPENTAARSELTRLGGKAEVTPPAEPKVEPAKAEKKIEPSAPSKYEGSDFLKDLIAEVDSFQKIEETTSAMPHEDMSQVFGGGKPPEELSIEGQIADIEFLLKETPPEEKPRTREELVHLFEDFKNSIKWQDEDSQKRFQIAQSFFQSGMYDKALVNLDEIRAAGEIKPMLVEMKGNCLVKLGRFADALRILPEGLVQSISEKGKLGMRYLLALAYQGQGDYRNALIQLEMIVRIDETYRDVKELYELLGGVPTKVEEEPGFSSEEPPEVETAVPEIADGKFGDEPVMAEEPMMAEVFVEPPPVVEEEPRVYLDEPPAVQSEYPVIEETPEKIVEFGAGASAAKAGERRNEENIVFL